MEIIGLGKPVKDEQGVVIDKKYIVEITETEFDMITGIAGRPHISSRYKPGRDVNIANIYNKVKKINEKEAIIRSAAATVKASADSITNSIPLTGD